MIDESILGGHSKVVVSWLRVSANNRGLAKGIEIWRTSGSVVDNSEV